MHVLYKVYEISQKERMKTEQIISIQAVFLNICIYNKNNVTDLLWKIYIKKKTMNKNEKPILVYILWCSLAMHGYFLFIIILNFLFLLFVLLLYFVLIIL